MRNLLKQTPEEKNDLYHFEKANRNNSLKDKSFNFNVMLNSLEANKQFTYRRIIVSATGRTVLVFDKELNKERKMLMFASNNYLGFANHPYIQEKIGIVLKKYGTGVGGPPLLNGYTSLMKELEERLSTLKKKEGTLIFPSGYMANLGLVSAISTKQNNFVLDKYSHASLYDGIKLNNANLITFKHNNLESLQDVLIKLESKNYKETFVCVEGVYSMDGDLAELPQIVNKCKKYGAALILDDAHGTGILGENGGGTAEYFKLEKEIDISMGTFSKVFALTGGFLSANRDLIDYIRYYSRPYVFSAALPPITIASVLAGLDLIENEPWRRKKVLENTRYTIEKLQKFELTAEPKAAIISVRVPEWINIRKANVQLDKMGVFLNAIEFPAVSQNDQRFRISISAEHTLQDIDKLVSCLEKVWQDSVKTS
ncbi:pyridoxal phosphate-dependent aminotransferase family protein [Seonamhaeicola sediminis]|uniref:Pyridoxal phosphate-dependent aminotransferase family protein n=1 Tax=Seonamhaeicola sediminis TaxID=2528206 RepID=A0A562YEY4_9FLAO|nr:pyridoxal phosphate-dependent aminotransferase family protein [Seonamhaeicola sediminis]TWO33266.1 pyridoxal phosphate-dependent aminotransferase family protein [Seonamhaeicola sediminis]